MWPDAARAPVPDQEVTVLKALLVGLCAFVLVRSRRRQRRQAVRRPRRRSSRSATSTSASTKSTAAVSPLLREPPLAAPEPRSEARRHSGRDAAARRQAWRRRRTRALSSRGAMRRRARATASPRSSARPRAICDVFGSLLPTGARVAWCESGVQTTAQNGQYLGLFQMGSCERRLFGHGETALEQAQAAHRYFVRSGPRLEPVDAASPGTEPPPARFVRKVRDPGRRRRVPRRARSLVGDRPCRSAEA